MTIVTNYKPNKLIINSIDCDIEKELNLIRDLKYFKEEYIKTETELKKLRKKIDKYTSVCPTCFIRFSEIHTHILAKSN